MESVREYKWYYGKSVSVMVIPDPNYWHTVLVYNKNTGVIVLPEQFEELEDAEKVVLELLKT